MKGHVRKRGKKFVYVIDIGTVGGKRKQKWSKGFDKESEAERAMRVELTKLDQNEFANPSKIALKEYLNKWLEIYCLPNLAKSTFESYKIIVDKHINPYLGHIKLQKLQPAQIQEYYAYAQKSGRKKNGKKDNPGLSNKTVHYHHRVLKQALGYAVKPMQLLAVNPADSTEPPKPKKYHPNYMSVETIQKLLEAIKGEWLEMPAILSLALGLRRGEVLGLKWSNIDFDNNVVFIKETLVCTNKEVILKEPKSEESRRFIEMPPTLATMLKKHRTEQKKMRLLLKEYRDNDLVCCNDNGTLINPSTLSSAFRRLLNKRGLQHIRFHDCRHTFATLGLESGISLKTMQELLGHATISMTGVYSHVTKKVKKDAANKIEEALWK